MNDGDQIGSYRVLRRIGAGGMGEVWLAEHVALGRRAAIKILHAAFSSRSDIVTRFFNEARAATAISDPGIVQIFDFGQAADGTAYIVMELLDGEPLDRRLGREGALPLADALRIVRQVAATLAAAHACGIVHRDLKPENIFLARDPEVASGARAKLLDFGIAKLADGVGVKTQTAAMMGTPAYMAPEQCRGAGQVDARADLYSLGCVLFALVAGRPPFDADGAGEIIAMHLREQAPRLASVVAGLPEAVDDVVARCLAKEPSERFASAAELADAVARIHPTGAPRVVNATAAPHSMPTTLSSMAMEVVRRPRASKLWLVGAVVAAAGALAMFAAVSTRSGVRERSAAPPPAAQPAAQPAPLPAFDEVVRALASAIDATDLRTWLVERPPPEPPPVAKPQPHIHRAPAKAHPPLVDDDGIPVER